MVSSQCRLMSIQHTITTIIVFCKTKKVTTVNTLISVLVSLISVFASFAMYEIII